MRRVRGTRVVVGTTAFLALIAAGAAAAPQAEWKGTIVKEGDVTVVKNPKQPLYKTPILELKEDLSIGGPDAQGEYALDQVRQVVVDDGGTMYVLDPRASHIKVFDASGKYLRTIGRKGQGPGELEYPTTMSLIGPRGELAVILQLRGVVFFKTDGTFLRQLPFKGMQVGRGRVDSRGNIYVLDIVFDDQGSCYATKKLAPDGSLLATISETPTSSRPGTSALQLILPIAAFSIDRADRFIYGYPETYEIRVYGPGADKIIRKIGREYDPVDVTEEEKAALKKDAPGGSMREYVFARSHPAYRRFFLSDLGHIFVQTYEKAGGERFVHDIFDAEGRFIGRIPLKTSGGEILKGKYYALEEDEDGYQYVKRYAVTWLVK